MNFDEEDFANIVITSSTYLTRAEPWQRAYNIRSVVRDTTIVT